MPEGRMHMEEKRYNSRIYSPTHKMGFKILSDTQLKNIFPTVDNLERKFEVHRKNIARIGELREQDEKFDFQYNLMYDSIFSIWGKRGSGKTSAIFTMKYRLEEDHPNDFVLPIIMPEMIPANCDIIGWILAILDREVKKLEDKIERNPKLVHDDEFFRHCAFDARNNSLRASYKKVKELASSRNVSYTGEEGSYAENIGNSERYTQNGFDFSRKLTEFWDILVRTIKKVYGMKKGEEPLIYIMFDDVDLTPDRVIELFSVIIKYLSHPNLIVITTADEGLFRDVFENDLRKKIKQDMMAENLKKIARAMLSQWDDYSDTWEYVKNDTPFECQVKETAELYIDKVLPPSERYYLELFDTCEKRRNFIENTDIEGKNTTLEQYIYKQIERLYAKIWTVQEKMQGEYNFLYYEKDSQRYFMTPYLLFMGNTSRQLANQCFILQELVDALLEIYEKADTIDGKEEKSAYLHRQVYRQMQHFLYNSINAGCVLHLEGISSGSLVENLLLFQKEQFPVYVNYPYLLEYYRKRNALSRKNENRIATLKDTVALFMLLFFVENILFVADSAPEPQYAVNPERKRIHGTDDLVELFDEVTLNRNLSLIKRSEDRNDKNALKEMLYLFEHVLVYPDKIVNFDIKDFESVREYLYNLSDRQLITAVTREMLQKWSKRNPKWFKTVSQILYLSYEGIYTLHLKELKRLDLKKKYLGNHKFARKWINDINLTDGTHLLKIVLMMDDDLEENKKHLLNELTDIISRTYYLSSEEEIVKSSDARETFVELCGSERKRYVDIFKLEEKFDNIMFQRYRLKYLSDKSNNKDSLNLEFIVSLGLRTVFSREQYKDWKKLVLDLKNDNDGYEYLKNWVESIIDEIQKRIYDIAQTELNYIITDVDTFEEAVSQISDLEKFYGSGNTQGYKYILDYCDNKNSDLLQINTHFVTSLYQQITRTAEQLGRIDYERANVGILAEVERHFKEIDESLLLAAQTGKQYEKLEEYLLMFYTLNYFTDVFYVMTIQQEKDQIGSKLDGHSFHEKDSFGAQMYKQILDIIKGRISENPKQDKKERNRNQKQYYYLADLLRTYFIDAGDVYIKQWRNELDE